MARYTPEIAATARAALVRLRRQVPGAVEMVYDNYNALVIGFSPSERASDAVLSIARYPKWVTLFFLEGAWLPDPKGLLQGNGTRVRGIRLDRAADIDAPAVRALIRAALEQAEVRIDPAGRRRMMIKSISPKQRPRRPGPWSPGRHPA
jgi:hypothetical protein